MLNWWLPGCRTAQGKVFVKEIYLSKALTCMKFSCINKNAFLSRRRIPLAKLLYQQFIHLT